MSSYPVPPSPGGNTNRRSNISSNNNGSSSSPYKQRTLHSLSSAGSSRLLPPPPASPRGKQRLGSSGSNISSSSPLNGGTGAKLPSLQNTFAQNVARSMTIEEMRALHRKALGDADAKQTELRLVLASRYRELVGSSEEVTKMRERSQELQDLVQALPELMQTLVKQQDATTKRSTTNGGASTRSHGEEKESHDDYERLRSDLAQLPRLVHRALDQQDVHNATQLLIQLFGLIAQQTDEYALATALVKDGTNGNRRSIAIQRESPEEEQQLQLLLQSQIRMTFLHVQTIPAKIIRMSKQQLLNSSSSSPTVTNKKNGLSQEEDPHSGAETFAAALSSLGRLERHSSTLSVGQILDLYFDAKTQLLQSLLNKLQVNNHNNNTNNTNDEQKQQQETEDVLSQMVLILQYDIILHPYQIFVLRNFPSHKSSNVPSIMESMPVFPPDLVQAKVSRFLSAHLPLIRTKVKTVLVDIAGTTAHALGKIRQTLYDKTDGIECRERLENNGVCTWDQAVSAVVDIQAVLSSSHSMASAAVTASSAGPSSPTSMMAGRASQQKFSLWSVLFSNTFSSLVHSILTTSFYSVHTKVVSTLRNSLAQAPPLEAMLPHEAYRNALYIASELDSSLRKVSADAHQLLVHAEEREESERRLRQSLYVQTCEIMGRLLCELRRMLVNTSDTSAQQQDRRDAVKELILGRLCHLLKFRLTALPTLLDPKSSPSVIQGSSSGMISLLELGSAFDLADDNDDGLISFQEATEAVDSAFSGTQFHGTSMVRETLLLPTATADQERGISATTGTAGAITPEDVTLKELTLLLARGLRHDSTGNQSALGTIQESLDDIVSTCMSKWAMAALRPHTESLSNNIFDFLHAMSSCSEPEYKRLYAHANSNNAMGLDNAVAGNPSPHIIDFLLHVSFTLNRSVCPSDSLLPVPSVEYAMTMGMQDSHIPTMMEIIRVALLTEGFCSTILSFKKHVSKAMKVPETSLKSSGPSAIVQLKSDVLFFEMSFTKRNQFGLTKSSVVSDLQTQFQQLHRNVDTLVRRSCEQNPLSIIEDKHKHVLEVCDLYMSSLFGSKDAASSQVSNVGDLGTSTSIGGSSPLLHPPLPSSCRFPLLPIQADRTLSGVQARGKYKEKDEDESRPGGRVATVRAGLGLFSSYLKRT